MDFITINESLRRCDVVSWFQSKGQGKEQEREISMGPQPHLHASSRKLQDATSSVAHHVLAACHFSHRHWEIVLFQSRYGVSCIMAFSVGAKRLE